MRTIITRDDYRLMRMALEEAKKSTCVRENRQFGTILVNPRHIREYEVVCKAHNRSPLRGKGCLTTGCVKDKEAIASGIGMEMCDVLHAEGMLIAKCAREGIKMADLEVYTTGEPCLVCARYLITAGIRKVIYIEGGYPMDAGLKLLADAGIPLKPIPIDSHELVGAKGSD